MNKVFPLFLLLLSIVNVCHGDNLKQITNKDGLSNSAILSICQDRDGYVWIGTCDGVNTYNGKSVNSLQSKIYDLTLSGNIIENIVEQGDDILWINTNYSLNRLDKKRWEIKSFPEIKDRTYLALDSRNTLFTLMMDNKIRYFDNNTFREITLDNIHYTKIVAFFIDPNNILHILNQDSTVSYSIHYDENDAVRLSEVEEKNIPLSKFCYVDNNNPNMLYLIDSKNHFFSLDLKTKEKIFIYDLATEISNNGEISSIICFNNEYYIAFKSKGLRKLQKTKSNNYELIETSITTGIFTMQKDRFQDLLWIGTDGGGIYILSKDTYSVNTYTFKDLNVDASMPVRAICVDNNDLWVGTKGDGLIKMVNFDGIKSDLIEYYNTNNTDLLDDAVYAIEKSHHDIFWIGTELGLNYYSKKTKRIHNLEIPNLKDKVRFIHDILEINDSTLWLATVGEGIIKLEMNWSNDTPHIQGVHQILAGDKSFYNFFFKIYHDEYNARLWFGNRGFGTFFIDYTLNNSLQNIKFNTISPNQSINDIYAISQDQKGNMWFGTTMGLIKQNSNGQTHLFNQNIGFSNDMIHSIIKDADNNFWMGTNKGIIRFDPRINTPYSYDAKKGLSVVEYSDGAAYKDSKTERIYFGGINGIAYIDKVDFKHNYYKPQIRLENLTIYGESKHFSDLLILDGEKTKLELSYKQDVFGLEFIALDFIDGSNFTYYYKIEGQNETWIDNGNSGIISFAKLHSGKYNLKIRYKNNSSGLDSNVFCLQIHIKPPWYLSPFMYIVYILLAISFVVCSIIWLFKRNNRKKELAIQEIQQQHRQESYNTKLSFFANIATEFLDPLTLIYAPCSQIINSNSDQSIKKSASLIKKNAEKINDLTQGLIEFAKYETENIKPIVKELVIKEFIDNLFNLFDLLVKNKQLTLKWNTDIDIVWNTDKNFLMNILMNLLSQTIHHADKGSTITVEFDIVENSLFVIINCSSTKYSELELNSNFMNKKLFGVEQTAHKSTLLTDVSLALTDKLVQLLEGSIEFESDYNKQITYTLSLPALDISENDKIENHLYTRKSMYEATEEIQPIESVYDSSKNTITLIYDNIDTLWTINEIFKDTYNIQAINDDKQIQSVITNSPSDLIIIDMFMNTSELTPLIKKIKIIDSISHIPIIVLSAKHSTAEQIEGVNAGVLMFISKPFDINHLKATIQTQMIGKEKLKKYLDSPLSAFVVNKGNRTHKEVIAFKAKIKEIISSNIENSSLSVQFISDELNMSTRQLYRKTKEMEIDSLTELIKEGRLNYSCKLLINSKLTIEEVIFKSGFSNRATFFRAFNQKFNCTPKEYRDKNLN